jgi:hypothetical protein
VQRQPRHSCPAMPHGAGEAITTMAGAHWQMARAVPPGSNTERLLCEPITRPSTPISAATRTTSSRGFPRRIIGTTATPARNGFDVVAELGLHVRMQGRLFRHQDLLALLHDL